MIRLLFLVKIGSLTPPGHLYLCQWPFHLVSEWVPSLGCNTLLVLWPETQHPSPFLLDPIGSPLSSPSVWAPTYGPIHTCWGLPTYDLWTCLVTRTCFLKLGWLFGLYRKQKSVHVKKIVFISESFPFFSECREACGRGGPKMKTNFSSSMILSYLW
jgi:hypothetical protein